MLNLSDNMKVGKTYYARISLGSYTCLDYVDRGTLMFEVNAKDQNAARGVLADFIADKLHVYSSRVYIKDIGQGQKEIFVTER